jgi:hypothetical protein
MHNIVLEVKGHSLAATHDPMLTACIHPHTPPTHTPHTSAYRLVCLYDFANVPLDQEEALYQVIRPSSVSSASFFGPHHEYLAIASHMETFSLWEWDDGHHLRDYGYVPDSGVGVEVHYLVNGGGSEYDPITQRLYSVAGSQGGELAILEASMEGLQLRATLAGGHTDIVRAARFAPQRQGGLLVSVGEDGAICTWN